MSSTIGGKKTYEQLCQLLASHFTPTTAVHKERRTFFTAKRGEHATETVNSWVARIKRLSANCKFGEHLEHNLTNKLISGLSGRALARICEEDETVTFEKVKELALRYELDEERMNREEQINAVRQQRNWGKSEEGNKNIPAKSVSEDVGCYACGHVRATCRFRMCNCGKRGHLAAVCRMKRKHHVGNQEQNTQEGSDCDDCIGPEQNYISKPILFTINKLRSIPDKPTKVGVRIGGRNLSL
ncbi:uncharacterized protein LOC129720448 [Wyeomyia smithii]|uniref:uncharacterized protein LOC129720448 n=1 Tax=Wyeomyia smithii TaxID=174621 RepID=UPI002467EDDB|nr:uncharacterized protein LOC129720448 [Wyeomyia smithii]